MEKIDVYKVLIMVIIILLVIFFNDIDIYF